jgi:hypothetical protein
LDSYLRLNLGEKPRSLRSLGTFVQYVLNGWLFYYNYQMQRISNVTDWTGVDSIIEEVLNIPLGAKSLDTVLQSMVDHQKASKSTFRLTGNITLTMLSVAVNNYN